MPFTINGGDSKQITIPVSLANAIVKVSCTDMFRNYFSGRHTDRLSQE